MEIVLSKFQLQCSDFVRARDVEFQDLVRALQGLQVQPGVWNGQQPVYSQSQPMYGQSQQPVYSQQPIYGQQPAYGQPHGYTYPQQLQNPILNSNQHAPANINPNLGHQFNYNQPSAPPGAQNTHSMPGQWNPTQ
jgi:hypothetical protein